MKPMLCSRSICRAGSSTLFHGTDLICASIIERWSIHRRSRDSLSSRTRTFSAIPSRATSYNLTNTSNPTRPHSRCLITTRNFPISNLRSSLPPFTLQRRFQSTSPIGPQPTHVPQSEYSTDLFSELANETQLAATGGAEGQWDIGYLKEILPDFGWGPTSTIEWLFEHVHVYTGTSIGVSILIAAVVVRIFTFPAVIGAADTGAKLGALMSVTKPLQERMREAVAEKDQMKMQHARQEISNIYKDADVKLWKSFLSPLLQIPLGFGAWRLFRNMADLPVPGMETGGLLWFTDLTTYDPYFILPVATGLIQHIAMRLGGDTGQQMSDASRQMRTLIVYGLPFLAPIFIGFAPASIQLSFCFAAILSFCSMAIMRNPAARKFLNVAPVVRPSKIVTHTPYQGTMTVSSRLANHPANLKAADARATSTAKRSNLFPKVDLKSLRNPVSSIRRTLSGFVGDVMPGAKQEAKKRVDSKAQSRADNYETKRSEEFEKARMQYEREQRMRKR